MYIGGLQKTTLIDYPGKIAATVFLVGCNFRCPWCYSAELVLPEKIKLQPVMPEKEFFDFLKSRKGLLAGVVICGGEPTVNKDLPQFIKKIKKLGFLTKLDTNGSNPEMLERLTDNHLLDYIAMDIKAPFGRKSPINHQRRDENEVRSELPKYKEATGGKADLAKIKKSVEIIKNSGVDYEFRTTVVPAIHAREDILQIARDISPAKKYYLQNFRSEKTLDPKFEKIKPYPQEFLFQMQKAISPFFEVCQVR